MRWNPTVNKFAITIECIIILITSFVLNSCVYYGDIHKNSQALDERNLAVHHTYTPFHATAAVNQIGWWNKFHDPELNKLIEIAIQDSPTMQIAETRVRAATATREQASATLWPSVDLSGYLQRQRFSQEGLIPPPFNGKIFNVGDLGLNFNYEFDFWGKNRQEFKSKINEERAVEAELAESNLVLSAAVAQVYFQLCHDITEVMLANEKWQVNQKLYQIVSQRMAHGVESDIPVKTILSNMEQAKLALIRYKQDESLTRNQLAVLLGKNPLTTDIQTKQFQFHHYSVSLPASLPASLLTQRPDIFAAKLRAEAAANQVNVAKARFFPNINLSLLYSYQSIELNNIFTAENRNNAITGVIDLPIFDAGSRRANLKVKYAEFDRAINEYNKTILTALREVADQLSNLQAIQSQLATQNISYHAIQNNYRLNVLRYHDGISDYVQVLENKNLVLQQKSEKLDLQTRYVQTVVSLLKALGGKDA